MLWARAVTQKSAQDSTVWREVSKLHSNQLAQPGFQVGPRFEGRLDPRLHLFAGAPVEGRDDGIFGRVVVVGRPGGDSRLPGNVPHGRGVEAFRPAKLQRRVQN